MKRSWTSWSFSSGERSRRRVGWRSSGALRVRMAERAVVGKVKPPVRAFKSY
jgi:hypothetical protein